MKKIFFFAIATLGMMVGCQKTEIDNTQKPIDDSERVAVQFGIDAPSLTVTRTKGAGPVEEWANQQLYILGYERDAKSLKLDAVDEDNVKTALIPNIMVAAPNSDNEGTINVVHPEGDDFAGEPYFYKDNRIYDFYGYYVDNAAGDNKLEATENNATIMLTIDGTQDVMAAKADPGLDVISGVAERNAYSAYAARRGVHPTLTFEHMLTRFNFHVVAGSPSGTTVDVTEITMDSYTEATLTVAPDPSLDPKGEKSYLKLYNGKDENGDLVVASRTPYAKEGASKYPDDYIYDIQTEILNDQVPAKIGNAIMAIAGETSHKIFLKTAFNANSNSNGDPYKQEIEDLEIPLNASDIKTENGQTVTKFERGYQYDIILTVYGPEKVEITAVLSKWKDGGNTTIDPDKWMEEPTEVSAYVSAATETSLTYTIETPNEFVEGQATLYDAAGDEVETQEFVPTKAKTADVTFEYLTSGAQYSLEVKVAKTADADYSKIEPVTVAPVAPGKIVITDAFYVCDKDSYNRLPESYRSVTGRSWGEYLAAYKIYESDPEAHPDFTPIPWLAVTILPLETETTATVNGKSITFNNIPAGKTLVTIAASEINGIDSFEAGETYTVALTSADETVSVDITVPEEDETEEPEVDEPVVESIVKKSYVVYETEESYNQLPEAYRAARGEWADYQAGKAIWEADNSVDFDPLPWLAIETTPAVIASFEFTRGEEVPVNIEWTVGTIGLNTFCASELEVDSLVGTWSVDVTVEGKTETAVLVVE